MAGWIKMPLCMEGEELDLGDFVLDGDPSPLPKKGAERPSPIFGPCPLWPNGWMDQGGTWHRLGPGYIVLDWDPAPLPRRGAERPPNFRPTSIVDKRLDA